MIEDGPVYSDAEEEYHINSMAEALLRVVESEESD